MMVPRRSARVLVLLAAVVVAQPAVADDLELSLDRGRVTITATSVPVSEILAEWSRIGGTTFVDADQLTGSPVTLQLVDVPESDALRILLRAAAGYVARPSGTEVPGGSRFDRVVILASSGGVRARSTAARAAPQRAVPQPASRVRGPGAPPRSVELDPLVQAQARDRIALFQAAQAQAATEEQPPAPGAQAITPPVAPPRGASTPGMIVPLQSSSESEETQSGTARPLAFGAVAPTAQPDSDSGSTSPQ
jgi:hypothetical protein